ncbi:MAG: hypothetical protein WBD40_00110 [Tepidisphaeraceae bacterium]
MNVTRLTDVPQPFISTHADRRHSLVSLSPEDIEAIATRTAELLSQRGPAPSQFWSTARVAAWLDVSEEWVRDHARELGAVRVGDGKRGELRFEPGRLRAALDARRLPKLSAAPRRRSGPRRSAAGVSLLPIPSR